MRKGACVRRCRPPCRGGAGGDARRPRPGRELNAGRPGRDGPAGRRRVGCPRAGERGEGLARHYGEFEEFLRTAPIAKMGDIPIGVTHPKRAFFAPGGIAGSAALKHLQSGSRAVTGSPTSRRSPPTSSTASWGSNVGPPTDRAPRRLRTSARWQLWVENCKLLKDVNQAQSPDKDAWAKQVWRQRTFDNLIANIDRNAGNLLVRRRAGT